MMKPLRKRHLQIWAAWALLLPAGIVFAWLAIPGEQPVKLLQSPAVELLPVIKQTSDLKNYTINIRAGKENTVHQLEWKNKTPLTVPSAVIYRISPTHPEGGTFGSFKPENSVMIGRIEARGDYVFPLQQDLSGTGQLHLILYDFIHEKIIDSLTLQP